MHIVPMELRHLDDVVKLGLSEEELHTRSDTPEFYSKETLSRWIQSPNGFLFVAEDKDGLRGFSLTSYNPDCRDAYVHSIVAVADHRQEGIGSQLLETTLAALQKTECNHVRCLIALENEPSAKLFEKFDFKRGDKFYYTARSL